MRTDPTPSDFTPDLPPEPDHVPGSEVSIGFQLWAMMIPTVAALALSIAMGEWW